MIVFLVFTRTTCRIVKRRPYPVPGEWVLELRVEFPAPHPVPVMTVALKAEPELLSHELTSHEVGGYVAEEGDPDAVP